MPLRRREMLRRKERKENESRTLRGRWDTETEDIMVVVCC